MTSSNKHTPGSWKLSDDKLGVWGNGNIVASCDAIKLDTDSKLANAQLIAAAPELLEALQDITRILEAFSYTTQLGNTQKLRLDKAKAAIAKARGQ